LDLYLELYDSVAVLYTWTIWFQINHLFAFPYTY